MPNLRDTLRTSLSGFEPASTRPPLPPPIQAPGKGGFSPNPSIRCPLPPFNVNIDTLRQFDQSDGAAPKRRVIPLPIQTVAGGGGSTVTNTTIVQNTGSSSNTALTAKTVVYTSPTLDPGALDAQAVTMAKSFQLIAAFANSPCEMRLYGSALSQAADAARGTDDPLPAELFNNLITDVVFDTAPYSWSWQNRVGVNTSNPQTTQAFLTAINTGSSNAQIQITLVFLPLES